MAQAFDRNQLLSAFDEIGSAAQQNGARLHIAVYGGSALMLASNFRFSSEDVNIAELPKPWPEWLLAAVAGIASKRGWSENWLNEAVDFHLSKLATIDDDHFEFGTFPRTDAEPGLIVYVPTAQYMLALKVKAVRVLDPVKGNLEAADIRNLMVAAGANTAQEAVEIMGRYFPRSAADAGKHLFLLRHLLSGGEVQNAPKYPL